MLARPLRDVRRTRSGRSETRRQVFAMSAAEQPGAAATSARAPTPWPAPGASEIGIGVVWNTVDDVSRTVTVLGGRCALVVGTSMFVGACATCGGVHPEVYARDRVHCCRTRVPRLRVGDHFGHPGTAQRHRTAGVREHRLCPGESRLGAVDHRRRGRIDPCDRRAHARTRAVLRCRPGERRRVAARRLAPGAPPRNRVAAFDRRRRRPRGSDLRRSSVGPGRIHRRRARSH